MKNLIYFLLIVGILYSCTVRKAPTFIKVDNIQFLSLKNDTVTLQANAYFKNENDIGGKIATDKINVIVNNEEVAHVSSEEFKVPANKDFSIPLKVFIPTSKLFKNNKSGLLGTLINAVVNKSIDVRFKGEIQYRILGFSNTYLVDKTEKVKLSF